MHRFIAYWLVAVLLTFPSWWVVAAHDMADGRDLWSTAGFATLLAAVLCLRQRPAAADCCTDQRI